MRRNVLCRCHRPAPTLRHSICAKAPTLSPTRTRRQAPCPYATITAARVPQRSAACWVVTRWDSLAGAVPGTPTFH